MHQAEKSARFRRGAEHLRIMRPRRDVVHDARARVQRRPRHRRLPRVHGDGNAETDQRLDDGRGVYFNDPSGHELEIITRPYGSGG